MVPRVLVKNVGREGCDYGRQMRFSLLHATYRAGERAVEVRDAWIAAADRPDQVEHLFASDADDEVSQAVPSIARGVVSPAVPYVTAVRNWNAAAAASSGDLLVVIADDLLPCARWDTIAAAAVGAIDPARSPFVLRPNEHDDPGFAVIRHPIVSRAWYLRHGLWCPEYTGYGVDIEFTTAARSRNLTIKAPGLRWQHVHPTEVDVPESDSHQRIRATNDEGMRLFNQRWPAWRRWGGAWPLAPGRSRGMTEIEVAARRVWFLAGLPHRTAKRAAMSLVRSFGQRRSARRAGK